MTTAPHGTQARYKAGCHCQPCKDATARAANVYRLKRLHQGPQTVDATGARRRIHSLGTHGWGTATIADLAGIHHRQVQRIATEESQRISVETAASIRAVFDQLSMRFAPTGTSEARFRASHAKRAALLRGGVTPLAWDDETIDNPSAEPNLGEAGHRPNGGSGRLSQDVAEDVTFLLEHDAAITTAGAAARLGLKPESLKTALARAGRTDLRDRLTFNAEESAA